MLHDFVPLFQEIRGTTLLPDESPVRRPKNNMAQHFVVLSLQGADEKFQQFHPGPVEWEVEGVELVVELDGLFVCLATRLRKSESGVSGGAFAPSNHCRRVAIQGSVMLEFDTVLMDDGVLVDLVAELAREAAEGRLIHGQSHFACSMVCLCHY